MEGTHQLKVFIGWSGERSRDLGNALHDWLPLVLQNVEPFLSEADIEAGERWTNKISKELEISKFGIICITRENVGSQWILFESGALAKSMQDSRVIPLLLDLDLKEISGPLAQFQAKKVDRTGINEVVKSLNQAFSSPLQESRVKQLFEALWPEFEKKIAAIPKSASSAKQTRPQAEILEELVASVRTLDSKFRDLAEDGMRTFRRRKFGFHPMMIHEFAHMLGEKPGDPISILIVASSFRDELPWLYELGMEAYRASKCGNREEALVAWKHFRKAMEFLRKGPFPMEELDFDPHMVQMIIRELDHFLHIEPEVQVNADKKSKRKKAEKPE